MGWSANARPDGGVSNASGARWIVSEQGKPPVRIGVIGLGAFWRDQLRPALVAASQRFRVVGLFDQVARRAEIEAVALRCPAVACLSTLIGRPDVDGLALCDPQWFGTHALELATRAGKPVVLNTPLPTDLATLDRIDALVRSQGLLIVPVGEGQGAIAERTSGRIALDRFDRLRNGEPVDLLLRSWADAVASARSRLTATAPTEPVL